MLTQSMYFINDDTGARELSPRSNGYKGMEYRTEHRSPYCQSRLFSPLYLHSHHMFMDPCGALHI